MATNEIFAEPIMSVICSHPTTPTSGQPVRLGMFTGVALTDESGGGNASGYTTVDFGQKVWDLSVEGTDEDGNSAVAKGDALFYADADGATLTKDPTGFFFGVALEAVNSAATATINVMHMSQSSLEGIAMLEAAEMADLARGSILVGSTSNRPTALDAKTTGRILVGDGTDLASVAVSGDATLAANGALSLAADCVGKAEFAGGINKMVIVAGQDETGDNTIGIADMAVGDELVCVLVLASAASVATITMRALTDFTVGAGALTIGANAANNAANSYLIFWNDLTA